MDNFVVVIVFIVWSIIGIGILFLLGQICVELGRIADKRCSKS